MVIKLDMRDIFTGSTMPPALAKIFGDTIDTCSLFVIANLHV